MSVKSVNLITDRISDAIIAGGKQASQTNKSNLFSEMTAPAKHKVDSGSVRSLSRTAEIKHLEQTETVAEMHGHG